MIIWKELIGYIGMLFLFSSFFFKDIRKLRICNLIGGIFCLVYGLVTMTIATAVLNIACVTLNIVILIKSKQR